MQLHVLGERAANSLLTRCARRRYNDRRGGVFWLGALRIRVHCACHLTAHAHTPVYAWMRMGWRTGPHMSLYLRV